MADYEDVLRKLMEKAAKVENQKMRETWGSTHSRARLQNQKQCIELGRMGGRKTQRSTPEEVRIEALKREIDRLNKLLEER